MIKKVFNQVFDICESLYCFIKLFSYGGIQGFRNLLPLQNRFNKD